MDNRVGRQLAVQLASLNEIAGGFAQLTDEHAVGRAVVIALADAVAFDDLQLALLSHDDEHVAVHVDGSRKG